MTVLSATEVAGSSSLTRGWNKQPNSYIVYFYAKTDAAAASRGRWRDERLRAGSREAIGGAGSKAGAWLRFEAHAGRPITMKIGISFVSVEQARRSVEEEIPGFDLTATEAAALRAWNRALQTVEIEGATAKQALLFYTALHHAMLAATPGRWAEGNPPPSTAPAP